MMTPRLRLVSVLVSGLLAAILTSSYVFVKVSTLLTGFGFFGDPIIQRGIQYLDREYPHWKELSELQKYASSTRIWTIADIRLQLPLQGRPDKRPTHPHSTPYRRDKRCTITTTSFRLSQ